MMINSSVEHAILVMVTKTERIVKVLAKKYGSRGGALGYGGRLSVEEESHKAKEDKPSG